MKKEIINLLKKIKRGDGRHCFFPHLDQDIIQDDESQHQLLIFRENYRIADEDDFEEHHKLTHDIIKRLNHLITNTDLDYKIKYTDHKMTTHLQTREMDTIHIHTSDHHLYITIFHTGQY